MSTEKKPSLLDMTLFRGFPFHYKEFGSVIEFSHNQIVNVGDVVRVRTNDGVYKNHPIIEIIETRPARGDWSGIHPSPDYFKVVIDRGVSLN